MARKKTTKLRVNVKATISRRLREVRQELFGEHGGPEMARRLNLPARTWYNYETGVTVPAEVLLGFIDQTGTNPVWLLNGEGSKFLRRPDDQSLSDLSPAELIRRGLEKLESSSRESAVPHREGLPPEADSDFAAVPLYGMKDLGGGPTDPADSIGHILAYRHWLPNPDRTVAVRLEDEAMHPILPGGSVVAIDRTVTDPELLQGRLTAACPDGVVMVRWLEISGRHLILRPNQSRPEYPIIPMDRDGRPGPPLLGQVVWSWSRFSS